MKLARLLFTSAVFLLLAAPAQSCRTHPEGTFPCGDLDCADDVEACQVWFDDLGGDTTYRCLAIPATCPDPCQCPELLTACCSRDADGQVTTEVPCP